MKRIASAVLALSLFAAAAHAEEVPLIESKPESKLESKPESKPARSKVLTYSRAAVYTCSAADFASTETVLRRSPLLREANPIAGQTTLQRGLVVAGLTVAVDLLTRHIAKSGRTKTASLLNFGAAGMHCGAAGWNLSR